MGHSTNSRRVTTPRGAALFRTDAQLLSGNSLLGRACAAVYASALRRAGAGIGCVEILCRAFAAGINR